MRFDEYVSYDGLGLAELVRRGEVTAGDLVEAAIARVEAVNPALNAVVHTMFEQARAVARAGVPEGAFAGVPFLVKDLDAYIAGEPWTGSSRAFAGYVPEEDSEIIRRSKRAGLIICGKTNTPEFGIVATTESAYRGPAHNPWNLAHTPGGSSGGSAAAVAAGMVPLAHGGDGGGSIRIPAANCGVFGLKPTRGRTPLGPQYGEVWNGMVCWHALTRSVRDSAAILDATHGPDRGAPYVAPPPVRPFLDEVGAPPGRLRIAVFEGSLFGREIHPDCVAAVRSAVELCRDLGHEVVEGVPRFDRDELVQAFLVIVAAGTAVMADGLPALTGRAARADDFEPATWFLVEAGRALSAADLERARATMHRGGRQVAGFFETCDVLLTATTARPPLRLGEGALPAWQQAGLAVLRRLPVPALLARVLAELGPPAMEATPNTMLFNQTGQPAMSVPLFWNESGLPIGTQFAGRFGDEATLFRLAAQLEQARPWAARRPPL